MNRRIVQCCVLFIAFATMMERIYAETPGRIGRAGLIQLTEISAHDAGAVPFTGGSAAWRLSTAYERRFDIAELDEIYLAGLASFTTLSVGASLASREGSSFFKETNLNFGVSYSLIKELTLLLGGRMQMITASSSEVDWSPLTLWHGTAGVRFDLMPFHLSIVGERLNRERFGQRYQYERVGQLSTEWNYAKDYSLLGGATLEKYQPPRFALAQLLPLGESVIASVGFRTSPNEYTGGIDIALGTFHFVYGGAIHPDLGFTHSVGLEAFLGRRSVPSGIFE